MHVQPIVLDKFSFEFLVSSFEFFLSRPEPEA